MAILCWPFLSCCSSSSLLPGGIRKSPSLAAESSMASFFLEAFRRFAGGAFSGFPRGPELFRALVREGLNQGSSLIGVVNNDKHSINRMYSSDGLTAKVVVAQRMVLRGLSLCLRGEGSFDDQGSPGSTRDFRRRNLLFLLQTLRLRLVNAERFLVEIVPGGSKSACAAR